MIRLIYVVSGFDSAFPSQVLSFLNELAEDTDAISEIILCVGLGNHEKTVDRESLHARIRTGTFRRFPQYPILNYLTIHKLSRLLRTCLIDKHTVIHTRNELAGSLVYEACRWQAIHPKLLIDVRGAIKEEISDFYTGPAIARQLKLLMLNANKTIYRQATAISAVSESLKNNLISNYGVDNDKIVVNPCIAGKQFSFNTQARARVRRKLNLSNRDTVVVFSTGGNNQWQKTKETVAALAYQGLKVLNLSKEAIAHPNVINLFIPYAQMSEYLSAADIAIIFRDHHVVNKVASPIKFSEYLACGLPVIANDSIDQVVDVIKRHRVGIIIKGLNDISKDTIETLKSIDRKQIARIGNSLFGASTIARSYIGTYARLIRDTR